MLSNVDKGLYVSEIHVPESSYSLQTRASKRTQGVTIHVPPPNADIVGDVTTLCQSRNENFSTVNVSKRNQQS